MIHKPNLKSGRRLNRKWHSTPRSKMEAIGIPTGLLDKFGREIKSSDKVHINPDYEGIVLYDRNYPGFALFYGLWCMAMKILMTPIVMGKVSLFLKTMGCVWK